MPTDPANVVQETQAVLQSALTISNLIVAGILISFALRLPKRLDASRSGEMTARKALGLPLTDLALPKQPLLQAVSVLAVCAGMAAFLLLSPRVQQSHYPEFWLALATDGFIGVAFVFLYKRIRGLHQAGTASRPAVILHLERGLFPLLLFILPFRCAGMIQAPWSWFLIPPILIVLAGLVFISWRTRFAVCASLGLTFTLLFLLIGPNTAGHVRLQFAESVAVSKTIMTLAFASVLLILLVRTSKDAQPRGFVWPPRRRARHA